MQCSSMQGIYVCSVAVCKWHLCLIDWRGLMLDCIVLC